MCDERIFTVEDDADNYDDLVAYLAQSSSRNSMPSSGSINIPLSSIQARTIEETNEKRKHDQLSLSRYGLFKNKRENTEALTRMFQQSIKTAELTLGAAVGGGDCFFDAVAQSLNERDGREEYTVKSLRLLCDEYLKNEAENNGWVKVLVEKDRQHYGQYLARLQYTVEEMKKNEELNLLTGMAIWGQPSIEGRIICEKLEIKIHVVEGRDAEQYVHETMLIHQIVNAEKSVTVEERNVNYSDTTLIHIAVTNHHFVPILKKATVVMSSDEHDGSEYQYPYNMSAAAAASVSSSSSMAADAAAASDSSSSSLPLSDLHTRKPLLKRHEYEAKSGIPYTERDMNMCIRSSLVRYNLRFQNGSRFIVDVPCHQNNNSLVAITPVIDVGTQYSCVSDYFKGNNLKNSETDKTDSPNSSTALMNRASVLWEEISPHLTRNPTLNIRILFAYTASSSAWVVGEILIRKHENKYQLHFYVYDPLGVATLQSEDYRELKGYLVREINHFDSNAIIKEPASPSASHIIMLAPDDIASSCVMAIEILLVRAADIRDPKLNNYPPNHYRNIQLQSIQNSYERTDPKCLEFISSYAKSTAQPEIAVLPSEDKNKVISYGEGEYKYLPIFSTEEEEIALSQNAKKPEVMRANEKAAFYAARTGNVLLLLALLGLPDEVEKNERKTQLARETSNLSYERREYNHKILIITMQIELITEYLKLPEADQYSNYLRDQINIESRRIIEESVMGFVEDHLQARDEIYVNMRLIRTANLNAEDIKVIKQDFRGKLSEFKTRLQTHFDDLKFELPTVVEDLKALKDAMQSAHDTVHQQVTNKTQIQLMLEYELTEAVRKHRHNAGKYWALHRRTLPDCLPQDEYGYWSHILGACVPIHARNHNYDTLLHVAYSHHHTNVALLLLARGACIEVRNNSGYTAYDLAHENKDKLLALKKRADELLKSESTFIRRLNKFKSEYQRHLAWQESWYQSEQFFYKLIGRFLFTGSLLTERKNTVETISTLMEIAEAEYNDTRVIEKLKAILTDHYNHKTLGHYQGRGLLNRSKLYDGLKVIVDEANARRNDYEYIRLADNIHAYLLACSALDFKLQAKKAQEALENERKMTQAHKSEVDELRQMVLQLRKDVDSSKNQSASPVNREGNSARNFGHPLPLGKHPGSLFGNTAAYAAKSDSRSEQAQTTHQTAPNRAASYSNA